MSLVGAGAPSLDTKWRVDGVALGGSFHRYLAIDRNGTVALPKDLAWSLREDRTRLGSGNARAAGSLPWLAALAAFLHTMITEYLSFILLLFALYTVAGGILVTGSIRANPRNNAGALALGTLIASIVGTTGAAMILIRPLIRTNGGRKHNAHQIVFFIILATNVGGALTPFGDPPLFVGFLHGVPFFWTTQHLWLQTVIVAVPVLALFVALLPISPLLKLS